MDGGGSGFAGRMEILTDACGRRRWPLEVKLRIVAESYVPGVRVLDVAERHGLRPNQVTRWRRQHRAGELVARGAPPLPPVVRSASSITHDDGSGGDGPMPSFVPLVLEAEGQDAPVISMQSASAAPMPSCQPGPPPPSSPAPAAPLSDTAARIEVEVGGLIVRLPGDVAPTRLMEIVTALRGDAGSVP